MAYNRIQAIEFNEAGFQESVWLVDIAPGMERDPARYRMSRKKGGDHIQGKYHNMDSPTVRNAGKRTLIEEAVLSLYAGGGTVYAKNGVKRVVMANMGQVERRQTERHKRLTAPLLPVLVEFPKNETFLVGFIMDGETPTRYQVECPLVTYNDRSTWRISIFRRINPRARTDFQYGMLPMSGGRKREEPQYNEKARSEIMRALLMLETYLDEGSKEFGMAMAIRRKLEQKPGMPGSGKATLNDRLRTQAAIIADAFFALQRNQTPENIQAWTNIRDGILANKERMQPKFEAHIDYLERRAYTKAAQAPQTPANSSIPHMRTEAEYLAEKAAQAAKTPANATPSALADIANLFNQQ